MERMTFRNGDGIACVRDDQCFEEQSGHYCGPAIDRLAAYEDTELEQEEITAMQHTLDEYHKVADPLLRAQADGRLVVLPCKVGQRVFALLDTDKYISECDVKQIGMGNKIGFIGLEPIGARGREYGVALNGFGKTVFLTREEAEKALKVMKDERPRKCSN